MFSFLKNGCWLLVAMSFIGCSSGGGRAGSEIPSSATTSDPLPQRQNPPPQHSGVAASRSEPVIYDYPGPTRNLNDPSPAASVPSQQPVARPAAPLSSGGPVTHTVQSGDTLWGISRKYDVTVEALRSSNAMTTDVIKPGQILKIP